MILAVIGSTEVNSCKQITDLLRGIFIDKSPDGFTSGGADGIDTISEGLFKQMFPYNPRFIYEPEVRVWNHPRGFKWRNKKIIKTCDEGVCIRHVDSKTYGSGWTADRIEDMGKPVDRYIVFEDYSIQKVNNYRKFKK